MDTTVEIERMYKEAIEEQRKELLSNFGKLSAESGAKLVMYSRELVKDEHSISLREQVLRYFNQLNEEGQKLALSYVEALAVNPKYRQEPPPQSRRPERGWR